jgi:calmodulin
MESQSDHPKLTSEQISEYREAFNIFDDDGDGKITHGELFLAMRALGENPADPGVTGILNHMKDNGSETVLFDEFLAIMSRDERDGNGEDELNEAFHIFDANRDGKISRDEFIEILKNFGDPLPDRDIKALADEAAADEEGQIDYHAFIKLILSRDHCCN